MKVSSERPAPIANLAWLEELSPAAPGRIRLLDTRDQDNPTAQAAFVLGRQRGYEAGLREGQAKGLAEGARILHQRESDEALAVATQLHEGLARFQDQMAALESQIASDLVSLAIDIARQVLRRELTLTPEGLLPVANEALKALGEGASGIALQVHPDDASLLRQHLMHLPGGSRCHLLENPHMSRGGLRLEADTGVVDASFEARWQAVMANMGRDEEPMP